MGRARGDGMKLIESIATMGAALVGWSIGDIMFGRQTTAYETLVFGVFAIGMAGAVGLGITLFQLWRRQ